MMPEHVADAGGQARCFRLRPAFDTAGDPRARASLTTTNHESSVTLHPYMKTKIALLSTLALATAVSQLTGCTSAYLASKKDVTLIERGFGIRVFTSASSTGNTAMPEVDCGAFSSIIHINNTSTNQLYSAPQFSTASAIATANPFNTSIQETWGAGNVSAQVQTNDAGGGTVVKTKAPTFIDVRPGN